MIADTLFILAAGKSSRMKNSRSSVIDHLENFEANHLPKSLIKINGKPFIEYLLDNAIEAGIKNVILIIRPMEESFHQLFGSDIDAHYKDLKISYAYQKIDPATKKTIGTADALYQALVQYEDVKCFLVCNSDNLYTASSMFKLANLSENNGVAAYQKGFLRFNAERLNAFAILSIDSEKCLKEIIEKPSETNELVNKKDTYISMNLFKFRYSDIFPFLENCPLNKERGEKELPTAIVNMLKHEKIKVLTLKEHVPDLTSKDDILIMKNETLRA
jgi:dTDP-glucose pyrophosphorylase